MLSWRVASAVLGIPLLLGVTYLGGWWLAGLTAALAWLGVGEARRLLPGAPPLAAALARAGAVVLPLLALARPRDLGEALLLALAAFLAGEGVAAARCGEAGEVAARGRALGAGVLLVFYPAFPLAHLVRLAGLGGFRTVWWVLVTVWACDTAAYFAGRGLGGRRLAPALSPGKTVAGAAAGLAAAVLAGTAYGGLALGLAAWRGAAFGALVGLAAQAGDLFESLLKRGAGVKDAGWLIPGHGGVLDRFDSLALALPVAYYLCLTRLA